MEVIMEQKGEDVSFFPSPRQLDKVIQGNKKPAAKRRILQSVYNTQN